MVEPKSQDISANEREMLFNFQQSAADILRSEDRFRKPIYKKIGTKIGLETEYSLLTPSFDQASEAKRDQIISENPEYTDTELGASQLEARTPPIDLLEEGFNKFVSAFELVENGIRTSAEKADVLVLRVGSNPFVRIPAIKKTTSKEKYQILPNFHNSNKEKNLDTFIGAQPQRVDVGDSSVTALFNSLQTNVEAIDFSDAVDKLNRTLMISPYITGVCANGRFLSGIDTGYPDLRLKAWEVSCDTRTKQQKEAGKLTRVGMPVDYYRNMKDYFDQIAEYPFILNTPEAAFQIGIGLNWRDARIKFIKDSLVIEFRSLSIQPTMEEDIAASLFYLGRLNYSQITDEPLMDFRHVRANKDAVMCKNLRHINLWTLDNQHLVQAPGRDVLAEELRKAEEGMILSGFETKEFEPYFDILKNRLQVGVPTDRLALAVYKNMNIGLEKDEHDPLRAPLIMAVSDLKLI